MINEPFTTHVPLGHGGDLAANLGLGVSAWDDTSGCSTATIRCWDEQVEHDGTVPFGYLSAIADNNNAMANINSADWTSNSILIEIAYQACRAARGTVEVRSHNSAYNDSMGVAQGVMIDDGGAFGQSQCTSVTVPLRPMVDDRSELPQVDHRAFPWDADIAPAPVDVYLRGGLRFDGDTAVYTSQLDSGWASNFGELILPSGKPAARCRVIHRLASASL